MHYHVCMIEMSQRMKGNAMTGFVKGFVKPELNAGQQSLLDLFVQEANESEDWREPIRIDKVEVEEEDSILIYSTRFVDLEPTHDGPHRHLQIMTVYRSWDSEDPYCDHLLPVKYREVMMTNVYRSMEGDSGWIAGNNTYVADTSNLHNDWV